MTFREKFDELKAKYGTVDESKLTEPFAIQVNMTEDESAGTFYVAFVNGVFSVEPYDYRDHTSMITLSVANLEAVLAKKADPVQLFLNGALQVEGSVDHALMLVDLMAKEEKKPAAKKAAAKKPAAKKAEPKKEEKHPASAEKKTEKKAQAPKAAEKKAEAPKAAEKKAEAPKAAEKKAEAPKAAEKKAEAPKAADKKTAEPKKAEASKKSAAKTSK